MINCQLPRIIIIVILLAPHFSTFSSYAQIISTIAGNGGYLETGTGGPATNAEIVPRGVTIDKKGNIYISELCLVRKIEVDGIIRLVAGGGGCGRSGDGGTATAAGLSPDCITIDNNGIIYIADYTNNCIRNIDTFGIIHTYVNIGLSHGYTGDGGPATLATLNKPIAVTCDRSGNLYIADYDNNVVRKVTNGIISTIAGNGLAGYSGDGGPATSASIDHPQSIILDSLYNLYIGDSHVIRKVNASGIISTIAGPGITGISGDGGPATAANFGIVGSITIDKWLNLYTISEVEHQQIRVITADGIIWPYVGNGTIGFSGDGGLALLAQLNYPNGCTIDNNGELYIADYGNNRIRKVSATTTVKNMTPSNSLIKIYPNPTTGTFTITLPQTNEPKTITLYDLPGRVITTRTITTNEPQQFNLSAVPGSYIAEVVCGGSVYRERVVVW